MSVYHVYSRLGDLRAFSENGLFVGSLSLSPFCAVHSADPLSFTLYSLIGLLVVEAIGCIIGASQIRRKFSVHYRNFTL